nr:glyoxalase/bleomycin resistance protein/dioxygenase [uncultured bacterium]
MLAIDVADAKAACDKAEKAGAKVLMPVEPTFWGALYGQFQDPFGHVWELNQQVREVGADEIQKATEAHFAENKL